MSELYLVIDNGSYNIKAGFNSEEDTQPLKIRNTLSKTKDGIIYIGNDYLSQTKHHSGINFKQPYTQGHLTSWETEKPIWDYTFDQLCPDKPLDPSLIHLTLTETPFQLPQLSINTDQIIFEEYGINDYYRCVPSLLVPWLDFNDNPSSDVVSNEFMLVIDSGNESTWITPMIYQSVYWDGVKKLPIGGALMNGVLKELISFRHYDFLDEPILINTIKEQTCFIARDFNKDLQRKLKLGCQFVLPDFKTTTTGYVRTADTPIHEDTQLLLLQDERFVVPESYYHPEIIFDNSSAASNTNLQATPLKNLIELIMESIMSCPKVVQPLLLANIVLLGGSTNLPNFKTRLLSELKKELPLDWQVRIRDTGSIAKDELSWYGGLNLTSSDIVSDISISKKDYFEHGANWCQKQFGFKNPK